MKTILAALIFFLAPSIAFATTCTNKANDKIYKELVRDSRVIFLGKAVSVGESDTNSTPVTFQVLRGWKGVDADKITVYFLHDGTVNNSVLLPAINSLEIVYAEQTVTGRIFSSYCRQVRDSEERLKKELGDGKVFEPPPIESAQPAENSKGFWARLWETISAFFS